MGVDAFFSTHGLGVGVGAHRTSSWHVAVLSNTGVVGSLIMLAFIAQSLLRRAYSKTGKDKDLMEGLKLALLATLVDQMLVGTSPDFGLFAAVMFGALAGLASPRFTTTPAQKNNPAPQVLEPYGRASSAARIAGID
jgi:hypothetical protein